MAPSNGTRKFAVITGASSGIGYHLASVFAENGYDLLVNSGSEKIDVAAKDFETLKVNVDVVEADLTSYDGVEQLWAAIESTNKAVDAIAINAGIGVGGDFVRETSLEEELKMIALNVHRPSIWRNECFRAWWSVVRAKC